MPREARNAEVPVYDRSFLLGEEKRNDQLALWEVQQYGLDSFGDPDYVSIYGLRPDQWYARGLRILARTAVECTRDQLADLIGGDIASVVRSAHLGDQSTVIDPCAGSCNTLWWIRHHVGACRSIGFEVDDGVFEAARRNLATIGQQIELIHESHETALARVTVPTDHLLIAFISPPWGRTLSESGLDLRRTTPAVTNIIDLIGSTFAEHKVLFATQLHETVTKDSIAAVTSRFEWATLKFYDINACGQNHGLLLGSRGWIPGATDADV